LICDKTPLDRAIDVKEDNKEDYDPQRELQRYKIQKHEINILRLILSY